MKLLDYNYESVMRGTFGSKRKQEWEQYKMYETQRLNQYPIKDFDPDILKITDKIEKDGFVGYYANTVSVLTEGDDYRVFHLHRGPHLRAPHLRAPHLRGHHLPKSIVC